MEIRLANMNLKAFITGKQIEWLINTIQVTMFLWHTCNTIFEIQSVPYNTYAMQVKYCNDFMLHYESCHCDQLETTIRNIILTNAKEKTVSDIQDEFIHIVGLFTSIATNVTVIELYIDARKYMLHAKVKQLCENKTELHDDEKYNTSMIRNKLDLKVWNSEDVANTINEVLNGFSYKSACYSRADKIIAAISLLDVELTQKVLQNWIPTSGEHPFLQLFTENNWRTLCTSENMSRLVKELPSGSMQKIYEYWLGCMQSKLDDRIFTEVITLLNLSQNCAYTIQKTLQNTFIEKINISGIYYEGADMCMLFYSKLKPNNICIKCANISSDCNTKKIIGRYTILATNQIRGLTQGIVNGDTQIVIIDESQSQCYAEYAGCLTITFNVDPLITECRMCGCICRIIQDYSTSEFLGVATIHHLKDEDAQIERNKYVNYPVIKGGIC